MNQRETKHGGTHVAGLTAALGVLLVDVPREERARLGAALLRMATGVIAVAHLAPRLKSAMRSRLANPEVRGIVTRVMKQCLRDFAASQPEEAARIVAFAREAARAKER